MLRTIVLASQNEGKLSELRTLLRDLPVRVVGVAEALGRPFAVEETGETFEENAILKAKAVCAATGELALADDSGLEVRALGNRPGVRSARFAHDHATDAENNAALLRELASVPVHARAARFRCVLALADPKRGVRTVEGTCVGVIAEAPRGTHGFGYDPLFVPEGFGGRTFAELSSAEKNAVSHRSRAMAALRPVLEAVLEDEAR
ncbi:MAG: RdgB/HAM1 family non-canonical purine NTP pyrophosphatase [Pseudomonadota bacterium]